MSDQKKDITREVKQEIKDIVSQKKQFYKLLSQKVKGTEEDTDFVRSQIKADEFSRNMNRLYAKNKSVQPSRRMLYTPNKDDLYLGGGQQSERDNTYSTQAPPVNYGNLSIMAAGNQFQYQLVNLNPIKTNTKPLQGRLYTKVDETLDYYDKKINTEKFLSQYYGSGNKIDSETLKKMSLNKRYDKIMTSAGEFEEGADFQVQEIQQPAKTNIFIQAQERKTQNMLPERNAISHKPPIGQKQFQQPLSSIFQGLAKHMIDPAHNPEGTTPYKQYNTKNQVSVKPIEEKPEDKSVIFVRKGANDKKQSKYSNRIDVRAMKNSNFYHSPSSLRV